MWFHGYLTANCRVKVVDTDKGGSNTMKHHDPC
jgi:hypothetical protein